MKHSKSIDRRAGETMPRTNAVIKHPKRKEIHAALLRNEPYRSVAKQYHLGPSSVYRYMKEFLETVPEEINTDSRVEEARENAVVAQVERLDTVTEFLQGATGRLNMIMRKLEELLQEGEEGPDLTEEVRAIVAAYRREDFKRADKLLDRLENGFAGDRQDRRATLRDYSMLVVNWSKVLESFKAGAKPEPLEIRWIEE